MDFLVNLANGLTGIVSAGADNLVGSVDRYITECIDFINTY